MRTLLIAQRISVLGIGIAILLGTLGVYDSDPEVPVVEQVTEIREVSAEDDFIVVNSRAALGSEEEWVTLCLTYTSPVGGQEHCKNFSREEEDRSIFDCWLLASLGKPLPDCWR